MTPTVVFSRGQTVDDGEVGGTDLASVLASWNQTGPGIIGDLNGDLVVDGQDLAIVLANWGICAN